jgi:hypothetical protein
MGRDGRADPRVLHCVQDEGDVVYFPEDWWHATCNPSPLTVGIGGQQYLDWPANASDALLAAARGDAEGLRAALQTNSATLETPEEGDRAWLLAHDDASVMNGPPEHRGLLTQPLHLAAAQGIVAAASLLMEAGADIHAMDRNRETPLCLAARAGSLEIVEALLNRGARPDDCLEGSAPLLHAAAWSGNLALVRGLVERWGQSPAQPCTSSACMGRTPFPGLKPWHGVRLAADIALFWRHADVVGYLERAVQARKPEEAAAAAETEETVGEPAATDDYDDDDMAGMPLSSVWSRGRAAEAEAFRGRDEGSKAKKPKAAGPEL